MEINKNGKYKFYIIEYRYSTSDEWCISNFDSIALEAVQEVYSKEIDKCFKATGYCGFLAKGNGEEKALAALKLVNKPYPSIPTLYRISKIKINVVYEFVEELDFLRKKKESQTEQVKIRANEYEWTCPICTYDYYETSLLEEVFCKKCDKRFTTKFVE